MASARTDLSRLFDTFDIKSRRVIIAAVSGGGDSTALLFLLKDYLDRFAQGVELVAAIVDHGLRADSAGEALAVARLCAEHGVAHRTLVWHGEKPETGLAAAAREARYRLLAQAAADAGTDLVFTGHTADDQAETALMRAGRREGRGLAGMAPATLYGGTVWIARPLLGARRDELRGFLRDRGVGWVDDPTNDNQAFERPRMRAELRGEAERIDAALADANAAGARREALGEAAALLIRRKVSRPAPGLIRIDPDFLHAEPQDAAVYALRILLAAAGGTAHLPDEARTAALFDRLGAGPLREALSRALVDARRNGIFLLREARGLPEPAEAADGMVWDGRYRISGDVEGLLIGPLGAEGARAQALVDCAPGSLVRAALAAEPALWGTGEKSPTAYPAPHPPAGTFSPYSDGEKEAGRDAETSSFSPFTGRRSRQGDEGQRLAWSLARAEQPSSAVKLIPLIAPWSRFLPSFDLPPARAVGELLGAPEIPPPPFQGHIGRKA